MAERLTYRPEAPKDDAYKREAYWACCPWCDVEKCIDHTTCKAVEEFAEQLRSESKEAQS